MLLQVESAAWNDKGDILTAIADGRLITWYYPNAVAIDRDLLVLASTSRDAAEFGKVNLFFFCSSGQPRAVFAHSKERTRLEDIALSGTLFLSHPD